MKITVTITEPITMNSFDIQVNQKQRIRTTLRVLSENMQGMEALSRCGTVRMKQSGRQVAVENTYEAARIYTGMELIAITNTGSGT